MSYKSKFTGEQVDEYLSRVEEAGNLLEIKEGLSEKADRNGHYPEFTAGFADNLVGRGEAIPAEFSFRASGGKSIEDGTARIKTLKGNAVVWNQKAKLKKYNETEILADGTIKIISTPPGNWSTITEEMQGNINNTYALILSCKGGTYENSKNYGQIFDIVVNVDQPKIVTLSKNFRSAFTFRAMDCEGLILRICVYNLTKMFGAGNEPLTIEEFYSRIPVGVDLNAYNDGEVIPFTAEGIKSIGDNACDEEWELGTLNLGTGGTGESSSQLRSKNFCKLIGGEEYNLHSTTNTNAGQILLYDKDYKFLDYFSFYGKDRLLEVPQQAQFFKVLLQPTYGITYNHDICVSLVHSGYKEGKYYPYEQDIRKIDQRIKDAFPNGMMPWDKVYNKNGKGYIVKGTGVVECGSLVNKMNAKVGEFSLSTPANYNAIDSTYNIPSLLISPYVAATGYDADSKGLDMCIYGMNDWMIIRDSRYTDVASFKSEMADVPLYYELAKPTIIEYDEPFNLDYLVWDFGTEEIIAEGASAPLKADIIYQFNAVDEIRELRQLIATMQAQMAQMVATTIE